MGCLVLFICYGYGLVRMLTSRLEPDYFQFLDYHDRGVPIGRPAEVNLRNNHAQYIFTW